MNVMKWLMVLSLGLGGCIGLKNEVRMILDLIKFYDKPTAVVAKICWGLSDEISFAEEVMHTDNAKTIQLIEKIKTVERYNTEDMLIVLDLNCEDHGLFLEEANKSHKFKIPYRWILVSNSGDDIDAVPSKLKNLSILVDSEVIVAYKVKSNDIFLRKVYKIDSTSDFIIETFAMWTIDNGLMVSTEAKISTSVRRKNLRGKRIAMSIVSTDESTKKEIYHLNDVVTDNLAKSSFHNILPLFDYLNATTELLFTDTWGYYVNNSWSGMMGHIVRGDTDICGSIILMRQNRIDILSYLTKPFRITARFVFRQPPLSLDNNLFYLPFRSSVWMCVGALIIILVIVIYLTARWEVEKNGGNRNNKTILQPDVCDVAILVAGAVVQQSSSTELKGFLGRVVTFIMFLICLFLYTSYSANIVALLQSSSDDIHSLSDLLNSKFELGVEDTPYTRHYFTAATDRVRKAIYDTKVARVGYKPNFMSIEEGVKKLQNIDAPFAFHMNIGVGYRYVQRYFYEHEKCGLREIEYIPNGVPWMSCRKQSHYKEMYKIGLARIFEHGIGDRINRLVYIRKPSCASSGGSFGSVNMMDFYPVLMCLLYGMIAALLLLGLEILVHKRQMKTTRLESKFNETRHYTSEDDSDFCNEDFDNY